MKNSSNTQYQFWRQDNRTIELTDMGMMDQKLDYIHTNPVEAGIVTETNYYLYSSASNYAGLEFPMAVEMME